MNRSMIILRPLFLQKGTKSSRLVAGNTGIGMFDIFSADVMTAFFKVILIDLVLAGDNAIVIGLAAAGLPPEQRNKAVAIGILAATALRIAFASVAVQLLMIVGLLLAGGLLLLWVCWKMWRELRHAYVEHAQTRGENAGADVAADGAVAGSAPQKTLRQAALQIVVADISMSLDNVLAVAGAARDHPMVLVFGLGLSIVLMGIAASFIARLLARHRWIAYVGLVIILFVALEMIWKGAIEIWPHVQAATVG